MRRRIVGPVLAVGVLVGVERPAYADNCSGLSDCAAGVKIALALLAIVLVVVLVVFAWEFLAAAAAEEAMVAGAAEAAAAEAAAAEAAAAEAAAAEAADAAALEAATTENSLNHIFQAKHNLGPLVQQLGSEKAVVEGMLSGLKGLTPASGLFQKVVTIAGQSVTVRGAVVNGIVRISTAFIP